MKLLLPALTLITAMTIGTSAQAQNYPCVASCKTSARGETLSTTPHHLQSKACNVSTAAEDVCAKCIGRPQNGQCGCGASVSMPRA